MARRLPLPAAARALVVTSALTLLGAVASAQPLPALRADPPTRGPEIPVGVLAGDADATATVLDAANLGFLPAWSVVGMYDFISGSALRGPGGGGLYAATPLPLLDRLSVGAAVELLRPGDAFAYGDSARLSLSLAARVLPSLSLGATWSHLFLGGLADVDTLDLSAAARLGRYAALSLVVRDLPAPQFLGTAIQRVYQPELALRPLGTYRLEVALSARIGEQSGHVDPALRLQFVPAPGFTVRGSVEYVRDLDGDARRDHALRATIGVQLDFASIGFGIYGLGGTRGDGSAGFAAHGLAATLRLSGDRYPALWRPLRFERIDLSGGATSTRGLPRLLVHLARLAADPRTDGVLLVMGDLDGSWATMEELRDAISALRAAGKRVVVYSAELSMKGYYAAAAAERLLLDPGGGVRFTGLSTQVLYLKGTLDKLGARADFVKIAEWKTAPEQLTRTGGSDEAHLVREAILDDIDARVLAAVARDRKLEPARVRALRDTGLLTAAAAVQAGLADELKSGEEVEEALSRLTGRRVFVVSRDLRRDVRRAFERPRVAILHVDGDIVEGRSRTIPLLGRRVAGHESLLAAIAAARADDDVAAIVVRIDSPGGNALASDLVERELFRSRGEKPIICSLGDTAASGGYFIAAGCDTIVAEPSTVTGSIGIFSGKVDLSGLAEKLGVGVEVAKRGPHADIESWFRPYSDEERAAITASLRYYYDRFVAAVAHGRALKTEEVEAVARGRVWTGAQARERRLVDVLGGLQAALALAAERSGLPAVDYDIVALPYEREGLLGQLADLAGLRAATPSPLDGIPPALRVLLSAVPASVLLGPSTPQARLDAELDPPAARPGP